METKLNQTILLCQRISRFHYLWLFNMRMQRIWQNDMFNLEAKEALKNIWCGDSHFDGKIKRMLLDAHCWFLWEIQELSCEELNLLTWKLIAAVLSKLFLVEQIQDWTKLKIHWNSDSIFYVVPKWSSFNLERIQANTWSLKLQHKTFYWYGYPMSTANLLY